MKLKYSTLTAALLATTTLFAATAMAGPMNWYGGPVYDGQPNLAVTAALVKAGGGPQHFKFSTALVSMLGEKTVNAEVTKLEKQYGKKKVQMFLKGMTFDVRDGLKRATEQGISLPQPASLSGTKLATTLVKAGTAPDGKFWTGYLFDHAISHKLHNQVMVDVANQFGANDNQVTHYILNQAMYDVAHALGDKNVRLAAHQL